MTSSAAATRAGRERGSRLQSVRLRLRLGLSGFAFAPSLWRRAVFEKARHSNAPANHLARRATRSAVGAKETGRGSPSRAAAPRVPFRSVRASVSKNATPRGAALAAHARTSGSLAAASVAAARASKHSRCVRCIARRASRSAGETRRRGPSFPSFFLTSRVSRVSRVSSRVSSSCSSAMGAYASKSPPTSSHSSPLVSSSLEDTDTSETAEPG